jgi:hypothetical protein
MVLPIKGVAFLTEGVFEKKISGAGEEDAFLHKTPVLMN